MGEIREEERSTLYYNTVTINIENYSKVWAGFRVANRTNIIIEKDVLTASHNGYKSKGIKHSRNLEVNSSGILIKDSINKNTDA